MSPVPLLRSREVVRAFERLGWQVARQKGSHVDPDKARTPCYPPLSVPDHPHIARGTLRALLAKAGVRIDTFLAVSE